MAVDIIARGLALGGGPTAVLAQNNAILRSGLRARTGLGRVMARTGRFRIACLGDSTTANSVGVRTNAFPRQLATALTNLGVPAVDKNFFGASLLSGQTRAAYLTYNPQVTTMDVDWGFSASVRSLGGQIFTNNSGTGKVAWTIPGNVDTIECYHLGGNTGAFNYDVDGGTATNIVTGSTQTFLRTTLNPTLGSHVLNITRVSGTANFVGALAYDSAAPSVDVVNLGCGSALSSSMAATGNPWGVALAIQVLAPDLTIFNIGINDDINSVAADTVSANMQALITNALVTGDVWIVRPTPIQTSTTDLTSVYQTLASANNCTYIDMKTVLGGSYAAAIALSPSLMFDANHPSTAGLTVEAGFLARRLLSL